jgi:hypothetical protein
MGAISNNDPKRFIDIACRVFKKYPKAVILFGLEDIQTGTAFSLLESKSDLKIFDKISLNVYAGKSLTTDVWKAGIGIEKELININDLVSIGGGYYMTKSVNEMLDMKAMIDHSVGLSFTGKF